MQQVEVLCRHRAGKRRRGVWPLALALYAPRGDDILTLAVPLERPLYFIPCLTAGPGRPARRITLTLAAVCSPLPR